MLQRFTPLKLEWFIVVFLFLGIEFQIQAQITPPQRYFHSSLHLANDKEDLFTDASMQILYPGVSAIGGNNPQLNLTVARGETRSFAVSLVSPQTIAGNFKLEVIALNSANPPNPDPAVLPGYLPFSKEISLVRIAPEQVSDELMGITPAKTESATMTADVPRLLIKNSEDNFTDGWTHPAGAFVTLANRKTYQGLEYKAVRPFAIPTAPAGDTSTPSFNSIIKLDFQAFYPFAITPSLVSEFPHDATQQKHTKQLIKLKVAPGNSTDNGWLTLSLEKAPSDSQYFVSLYVGSGLAPIRKPFCNSASVGDGLTLNQFNLTSNNWFPGYIQVEYRKITITLNSSELPNVPLICEFSAQAGVVNDLTSEEKARITNTTAKLLAGGNSFLQFGEKGVFAPHTYFSEMKIRVTKRSDGSWTEPIPLFSPEATTDFTDESNSTYRGVFVNSNYVPPTISSDLSFTLPANQIRTLVVNLIRRPDPQNPPLDCIVESENPDCRAGYNNFQVRLVRLDASMPPIQILKVGVTTKPWGLVSRSQHQKSFITYLGETGSSDYISTLANPSGERFEKETQQMEDVGFTGVSISSPKSYGESPELVNGSSKLKRLVSKGLSFPVIIRDFGYSFKNDLGENLLANFKDQHADILPPNNLGRFYLFGFDEFHAESGDFLKHLRSIFKSRYYLGRPDDGTPTSPGFELSKSLPVFGTTAYEFMPKVFDENNVCISNSPSDCSTWLGDETNFYPKVQLSRFNSVFAPGSPNLSQDFSENIAATGTSPEKTAQRDPSGNLISLYGGTSHATFRELQNLYWPTAASEFSPFLNYPSYNTNYFESCQQKYEGASFRHGSASSQHLFEIVAARRAEFSARTPPQSFEEFQPSRFPGISNESLYWQSYEFYPLLNRFMAGVYFFTSHFESAYVYSYQATPQKDPFAMSIAQSQPPYEEEISSSAASMAKKTMMLAYPTSIGPLSTLSLEAVREGITDFRYLATFDSIWKSKFAAGNCAINTNSTFCSSLDAIRVQFVNRIHQVRYTDPLYFDDRFQGRYTFRPPAPGPEHANNCRGTAKGLTANDYELLRAFVQNRIDDLKSLL